MVMSAMVQILNYVKDSIQIMNGTDIFMEGERWNVLFNEAKPR